MNYQFYLSDMPLLMQPLELLPNGIVQTGDIQRVRVVITTGKVPPNPSVTDATALALVVNGVFVVAKPGVTRLRDFHQMFEQLLTVSDRTQDIDLNDVNPSSRKNGYYYIRNIQRMPLLI